MRSLMYGLDGEFGKHFLHKQWVAVNEDRSAS
jgi:hypothetical protein